MGLVCPDCGKSAPFTVWDSINTALNPELKQEVLDRSLPFRVPLLRCCT